MLVPDRIEEEIKRLYQLARANPEDENLRTAVQIVKTVRRSRFAIVGLNLRNGEIDDFSPCFRQSQQMVNKNKFGTILRRFSDHSNC